VKAIASGRLRNEEFSGGRAVAVFWLVLGLFVAGLIFWVPRHRARVAAASRAAAAVSRARTALSPSPTAAAIGADGTVAGGGESLPARSVSRERPADPTRPLLPPIPPEAAPLSLSLPIAGLSPADLRDSFEEVHSGHRHEAIDILSPRGTPVLAVADGTVRKLFHSVPGGITVYEFDTTETFCFYYAHLERYADGLAEGQRLRSGDRIGYVGTSGNAPPQTPHLHFAISRLGADKHWWQGTPIDPYPFLVEARRLP